MLRYVTGVAKYFFRFQAVRAFIAIVGLVSSRHLRTGAGRWKAGPAPRLIHAPSTQSQITHLIRNFLGKSIVPRTHRALNWTEIEQKNKRELAPRGEEALRSGVLVTSQDRRFPARIGPSFGWSCCRFGRSAPAYFQLKTIGTSAALYRK